MLFRQSGSPKAVADRAADRKLRIEVIPRRKLTDLGIAEITVMLETAGGVESQCLDRFGSKIDIAGLVLAAPDTRIGRCEAGVRLGTPV